jgi:hypothetical protein
MEEVLNWNTALNTAAQATETPRTVRSPTQPVPKIETARPLPRLQNAANPTHVATSL